MAALAGTMIFDGDCGICTAAAEWVRRHDRAGRVTVVPYQLADLDALSPGLTPEMTARSVYFVTTTGRRFKEARASFGVLKRLPAPWSVAGALLANPVFAVLAAPAYRLIAINRARLSAALGLTACAVPSRRV